MLIDGKSIVAKKQRVIEPSFELPRDWPDIGRKLVADYAVYIDSSGDRPSGFLLFGVRTPVPLATQPAFQMDGRAVVLTSRDMPWIEDGQCFIVSNLTFEQLLRGRKWQQ